MSSRLLPIIRDGMPVATSTFSIPRLSSPSDSASVLPHSCVTTLAISLKFASSSALSLKSGWMRSPAGVRRQSCSAFEAASTALATSAAPDSGASASTSPVAGLRTGIACDCRGGSQCPSTKFFNNVSCPIIACSFERVGSHLIGLAGRMSDNTPTPSNYGTTMARPTISPRASALYAASVSSSENRCVTIVSGRKMPFAASRMISGMSLRVLAP